MDDIVILSMLVLGCIAIVAATILFVVSQKFAVSEDHTTSEIEALLPQANCGGCGKAGCHDFACACAKASETEFADLYCSVGGQSVMDKIASIRGFAKVNKKPTAAVLLCNGSCQNAPAKVCYDGINSCQIAARISSGQSGCPNGCLRLGDCVKACKFGALTIDAATGIPHVDYDKCVSCGACVAACPRGLLEIRTRGKDGQMVYVACKNTQKGAMARKNCKAACIGCMKCTKINPEVVVTDNLSYIPDSVSPEEYGEQLHQACPTGAIRYYQGNQANGESQND